MVKNRDCPTELKTFNSVFTSLSYRHEPSRIFADFLGIVIACLGHGTQEPQYFEIINRYERKEIDLFSQLFAQLMIYYNENISETSWCDPLGTYYELLASNSKKSVFGQFFTPTALCELMVRCTINKEEWGKQINEPACGSGRLVLAANALVKGNKYLCQDTDLICCQMTAINLAFHKVNGIVYHMNSLTIDEPRNTFVINHEYWKHETINILQPKKNSP